MTIGTLGNNLPIVPPGTASAGDVTKLDTGASEDNGGDKASIKEMLQNKNPELYAQLKNIAKDHPDQALNVAKDAIRHPEKAGNTYKAFSEGSKMLNYVFKGGEDHSKISAAIYKDATSSAANWEGAVKAYKIIENNGAQAREIAENAKENGTAKDAYAKLRKMV